MCVAAAVAAGARLGVVWQSVLISHVLTPHPRRLPALRALALRAFATIDTDGSGTIGHDELGALLDQGKLQRPKSAPAGGRRPTATNETAPKARAESRTKARAAPQTVEFSLKLCVASLEFCILGLSLSFSISWFEILLWRSEW